MMGKLTEDFNKFDNIQNKYLQVQADITEFEIKNKDNEVLQQYKKLLNKSKKKKFADPKNMGVNIDKNEYYEIILSNSAHPENIQQNS